MGIYVPEKATASPELERGSGMLGSAPWDSSAQSDVKNDESFSRMPLENTVLLKDGGAGASSKGADTVNSLDHPIHVCFPNGIILTLYGPLMGTTLAPLASVAFLLSPPPPPFSPYKNITLSLFLISSTMIFSARVFSLVHEDSMIAFLQIPRKVFFRPGFWFHGGIPGAGLGLVLAWKLGLVQDIEQVAAALCIGLSLYEAISRMGCYTYRCCFGRPIGTKYKSPSAVHHTLLQIFVPVVYTSPSAAVIRQSPGLRNIPLFPIQWVSAAVFSLQFLS
jgi:hypothetical protein